MEKQKDKVVLLKYNFAAVIGFEIIYKIISAALFAPAIYTLLNFSVKAAGLKYLSSGTERIYFGKLSTYCTFFVILIMLSAYVLINISGLIYAMECSHRREKTNPLSILISGVGNALRIINPKNMGIMIYVLLVLPFSYTITISGSLFVGKLPEFVNKFLRQNKLAIIVIVVLYFALSLFALMRIFTLNFYTCYRMSFLRAVKCSKKVVKENKLRVIATVIFWNIVLTLFMIALGGSLSTLIAKLVELIIPEQSVVFVINYIIKIVFLLIYFFFSIISTPIMYAYICKCFFSLMEDEGYEEYMEVKRKRKKKSESYVQKRNSIAVIILIIAGIILDAAYIYMSVNNKVSLNILYPTRASVTAHRGDSENAPENTMAAIRLAHEKGADIIEIDVRQTADGQFVVIHDESLARTTGVKKKVGEVSFDYIKTLDAGSWFSKEYEGEEIPSLEEVLIYASDNNVYLNIELKPAKTDSNYAEGFVELIRSYEYEKHCMIGSDDLELLRTVKALDEKLETLYIMHMAFGEFADIEGIDNFSIRYNYISSDMVKKIHAHGKKVYAWTVNFEPEIKQLLLHDVDGIITDDPYESKKMVYNANNGLAVDLLQRLIEKY